MLCPALSFRLSNYPCERIDGSTASRDRQAAIDRYSKGEWDLLWSIWHQTC